QGREVDGQEVDGQKGRQEGRQEEVREEVQGRQEKVRRQNGQDGQEVTRFDLIQRQGASLPFSFMRSLLAPLLALLLVAAPAFAQQPQLPVVQLNAGMHLIRAEVAADYGSRMTGLMQRASMPSNAGMLFIFDEATTQCMWMKNTLIPLSVAFIDDKGAIINVEEMEPQTEDSHCAKRPARYALEMNRGWFAARGIKPGSRTGGIPGTQ